MSIESRIQYHKDQIKKLEEYTPSYTADYLKIGVLCLIFTLSLLYSVNFSTNPTGNILTTTQLIVESVK